MRPLTNQTELDFDHELPAGKEWFSIRWLSHWWGISEKNIKRLIEDGSLRTRGDFAPLKSKHALLRIHRATVIAFLDDRTNLQKFEAMRHENRTKKKK